MRWNYKEPDEYSIITDGKTVWIYRPLDKQVMVGRASDYFGDTNFTEFFTDPAKLHHKFTIEKAAFNQESADAHILRLVPKTGAMNVKEVFLFISKTTHDITRSDTYNAFGDKTRLQFSGFKVGRGADESLFHFDIPEGTDVLQLDKP
jgi:outer membrane lipoprotein carrier protein